MASLKFLWFMCGFLVSLSAVITSVTSLECNTKFCRSTNGNTWCAPWPPTKQCKNSDETCSTTTITVGPTTFLHQMCEPDTCDFCGTPTGCVQTCCNIDLCNKTPAPFANDKQSDQITVVDKKKFLQGVKNKEIKKLIEKLEASSPK
ncbi:hypothetical protein ACROYT_G015719 [Oculina patagonica]